MSLRIRCMSWNIHKGIGVDRRFRPERVLAVIRHHSPDVLLLQEVDRGVPRSRRMLLDRWLAQEAGYPYSVWFQNHALKVGGYGNATLSRFPIRRKRSVDLTIRWRKRRNALYTRLELPGHWEDLHVFNWHLGLSSAERAGQVQRLLASGTFRHLGRNPRILLGGDTNDWRNLLYLHAGLKEAGFQAWSEHGRRRHLLTYPAMAPVGALDKFFWKGSFRTPDLHRSRLQLARLASDHQPLIAEFDLASH